MTLWLFSPLMMTGMGFFYHMSYNCHVKNFDVNVICISLDWFKYGLFQYIFTLWDYYFKRIENWRKLRFCLQTIPYVNA